MPRNLELKVKLDSFRNIRAVLRKQKLNFKDLLVQKDIYYKTSKGLLKLRVENSRAQLIKYSRDETGDKRWSDYQIMNIESKNADNFFNDLFEFETVVAKKRELYIYKNTRIHLDKVEKLGVFLELETVVKESEKKAEKEFNEVIKLLELGRYAPIKTSYSVLADLSNLRG